jgi:Mrp family chromosome partitioning ATPase
VSRNFDIFQKVNLEDEPAVRPPIAAQPRPAPETRARSRKLQDVIDDEITKLVQRLFIYPGAAQAPGAVTFAGVGKSAGCSWVCARTSEVLANQIAGTVCVVDANLRAPSLHDHFRFENKVGFADAITGTKPMRDYARRASGSRLWLITAGAVGKEPNGALNPARLRARMTELRDEFDYVLLDTPGVLLYGDAVLLGQMTDGMILVVGSNETRRESARLAKDSIENAQVPLLGAVLNRRKFPIPEMIYRKL